MYSNAMSDSVSTNEIPIDPVTLGHEIARTAAHLDAATHRLLTCIRAFDASGEWERQGALSCAHWLAWRIGLDPGAARERVRVARALGGLPLLDEELRRGRLSYAKVRALTRIATNDNEANLVEMARSCTGAQLERLCRRLRRVVDATENGDRLDDRRYVKQDHLENGMVRLSAVLHPDEAALVMKAIEQSRHGAAVRPADGAPAAGAPAAGAIAEQDTTSPPVSSGKPRSPAIPMADALVNVAQSYLARTDAPADPVQPRSQLLVHLDQDPLAADGTLAPTLDDGTRVSSETWRRLSCDTTIVPVHHHQAGETIGRRTRTVAPLLRLALWQRDRGCRFPGCTNYRFVHAHHIRHWAHGGPTTADNLVLLCSTHHRLVHEGGFALQRSADGELCFADRHGRLIESAPRPPTFRGEGIALLERLNAEADVEIDADTGMSAWQGDAIDYQWALDAVIRAELTPMDSSGFPRIAAAAVPDKGWDQLAT
jgi:hypothetical protein